ncbi:hypothetical protein RKD18_004894 [Streptomyces phaeoluteigriseus]
MRIRSSFPYETAHEDLRIRLPDGTLLYARVWRPLTDEPVPALLEYTPDRLSDRTAARDRQRHPWYAGHGYASVRVDARGHGNSEGLPDDAARPPTKPAGRATTDGVAADGAAVVAWLAAQPWCDGTVGMFGIGPGGACALSVAAHTAIAPLSPLSPPAPTPLKAVVAVCCPDGRPDTGVRRPSRSPLPADPPHAEAARARLASVCLPPDPEHVGDAWRDMWLRRLESLESVAPPAATDAVENPTAGVPVLAVGGWHDPYPDTVLGLVERLPPDRVRGLIGPWPHTYPDHAPPPGPAIGFLQETLRWWDHWLKGKDTGVLSDPPLRAYLHGSHPADGAYGVPPGRWVGESSWPSARVRLVPYDLRGAPVLVRSPLAHGCGRRPDAPARRRGRSPAGPARRGRALGPFRPPGGRGDVGAGRPPGAAAADVRGAARPGGRPRLRRGTGRLLDPRDPRRTGASARGPRKGRRRRRPRPGPRRPRLPARPSHPSRRLLGLLAVGLARAGLGGGVHRGPGGQHAGTAGA